MRFEVRTNGCLIDWDTLSQWLCEDLHMVNAKTHCMTISPSTLLQNASEALASVAGAGLFSHAVEDAQRPLPAWKRHN
jgi:hypothetical protein